MFAKYSAYTVVAIYVQDKISSCSFDFIYIYIIMHVVLIGQTDMLP